MEDLQTQIYLILLFQIALTIFIIYNHIKIYDRLHILEEEIENFRYKIKIIKR